MLRETLVKMNKNIVPFFPDVSGRIEYNNKLHCVIATIREVQIKWLGWFSIVVHKYLAFFSIT